MAKEANKGKLLKILLTTKDRFPARPSCDVQNMYTQTKVGLKIG